MKNKIQNHLGKTAILALVILLLGSCKGYFENPLQDKETGEDINLLILDFNFFTSRMSFKLYDAADSSLILMPANLSFSGQNGNDIVNFSGEKKPVFTTTQSQIELTIDPNISISSNTPFQFAVNIEVDGYTSFQQGFQFSTKGKKTYELYLNKPGDNTILDGDLDVSDGDSSIVFIIPPGEDLKSATAAKSYEVHHKINLSDFLLLKDTEGNIIIGSQEELNSLVASGSFASLYMNISDSFPPKIESVYYSGDIVPLLFQKLETGSLDSFIVAGKQVGDLNGVVFKTYCEYTETPEPDLFGFGEFKTLEGAWFFNEPITDSLYFENLDIDYAVAQALTETLCETGSSLTFSSSEISSFSIDADVYDANDNWINSINFKGNFPETFTIENAPSRAVKLVFRNNNPSFVTTDDLMIDNLCEGNYNINIVPVVGYESYQVVLKAICPDNTSVAIAPTYSGEIKIKGSSDLWQGVDMVGGKVDLLGKPNTEYELRLLWEDEWEYSTYSTSYNSADGSYTGSSYPKTAIESEYIEEGSRIRFNVEKEFNQNVCDDLGW